MTAENPSVEERQGYLGGSDAGAILGHSPFASMLTVYADKMGVERAQRFDDATIARFYFGHMMEPVIAAACAKFHGLRAVVQPRFLRAPAPLQFMGGHLDFDLPDEQSFLECKNIRHPSNEWGKMPDASTDDASELIPKYYLAQCDHYMVVTSAEEYCYLAALMGGCELRLYRIYRDAKREEYLVKRECEFWERVQTGDPPFGKSADDFEYAVRIGYIDACTKTQAKKKDPILIDDETIALLWDLVDLSKSGSVSYKRQLAIKQAVFERVNDLGLLCDKDGKIIGNILTRKRAGFDDFGLKMQHPELYEQFKMSSTYPLIGVADAEEDSPSE